MKFLSSQRFLAVYSGVLTVVFCVTVFAGFAESRAKVQDLDEINVHRINVREPDGTLRMVISNMASFPGAIIKGKEYPHPRHTAAVLFFDNEGTEDGGLIFGGQKGPHDAYPQSYVHLSFDQYMQDQVLALDAGQEKGKKYSTIDINDVGDYPITDALAAESRILKLPKAQQKLAWEEFKKTHPGDMNRIKLGRLGDKSTVLEMKDATGKNRIVMKVAPDGAPSLEFLDAQGKVVSELPEKR